MNTSSGQSDLLAANRVLRSVSVLGLASLASGVVVGGIGGRLVMSVSARAAGVEMFGRVTENGNVVGEFTVGGTIALVVFVGLLGGVAASVGVVASEPWLRWLGPFRGVGFGVLTLAGFGYEVFASFDFRILDPVFLNVTMFLGLFVLFGVVVVGFQRLFDRRLPAAADEEQAIWLVIVGLGAIPLSLALLNFTSESFCGCEPAHEIGASLLIMIISTVVYHLSTATSLIPGWGRRVASATGYLSVGAAVLFGMIHTVDNIRRLL